MANSKSSWFEDVFLKDYTYFDISEKMEIWRELEKIVNGKLQITRAINQNLMSFKLEFTYKSIHVNLIESDTKPLKMLFEIKLKEPLEFNISLEDNIEKLMKFFGVKELEIQHADFDKKYFIQTIHEEKVKLFFEKKELTDMILMNDIYGIICSYEKESQSTKIITVANRNIDTLDELVSLVRLQLLLIDRFYEKK